MRDKNKKIKNIKKKKKKMIDLSRDKHCRNYNT